VSDTQPAVEVKWVEGMQFVAQANASQSAFVIDGSTDSGGFGTGVRPMEALLASLAACSAMDLVVVMRKKRLDLRSLRVLVTGERAEEHPRRWTKVHLEYVVSGVGLTDEAIARAIDLSLNRYCSVAASLSAEITSSYRLTEVSS